MARRFCRCLNVCVTVADDGDPPSGLESSDVLHNARAVRLLGLSVRFPHLVTVSGGDHTVYRCCCCEGGMDIYARRAGANAHEDQRWVLLNDGLLHDTTYASDSLRFSETFGVVVPVSPAALEQGKDLPVPPLAVDPGDGASEHRVRAMARRAVEEARVAMAERIAAFKASEREQFEKARSHIEHDERRLLEALAGTRSRGLAVLGEEADVLPAHPVGPSDEHEYVFVETEDEKKEDEEKKEEVEEEEEEEEEEEQLFQLEEDLAGHKGEPRKYVAAPEPESEAEPMSRQRSRVEVSALSRSVPIAIPTSVGSATAPRGVLAAIDEDAKVEDGDDDDDSSSVGVTVEEREMRMLSKTFGATDRSFWGFPK